jgi:dihydroorotate dehydrogenase electron transfer subunit
LAYEIKKNTDAKIYVVLGAKTGNEIVCTKEFSAMGAEVLLATEDGSLGKKGLVSDVLKNLMEKIGFNTAVYGCGPNAMLKEIAKTAPNCQFSLEERMACGVGVCLGCAVKTKNGYKLACKDGPVFDGSEVIL